MPEYQLYCFAQSGNAYRAALMLNLIGADWEPIWVDFFGKAEQRTPEYRTRVNEMGEIPVMVHGPRKLTQSGVILTYLADRSGQFRPADEDERLEALRWILFDNQKLNGFLGPYRFLRTLAKPPGDPTVLAFQGPPSTTISPFSTSGSRPDLCARRAPDHRRSLPRRISLLPGGRIRIRHRCPVRQYRRLAAADKGAAGMEAPL
jgi:hypothetical protein